MHHLTTADRKTIEEIAERHCFSIPATVHMLDAVIGGQGTVARFTHEEFAGAGQWMRDGMILLSDMYNVSLKARVGGLCEDLASLVARQRYLTESASRQSAQAPATPGWNTPRRPRSTSAVPGADLFDPEPPAWWGQGLRQPDSSGTRDGVRYAYFARQHRLAVEAGGTVTLYDTLDHRITGFSQRASDRGTAGFISQHGKVPLGRLPVVAVNGRVHGTFRRAMAAEAQSLRDVVATIQRLLNLRKIGILTAEEFSVKKAQLLAGL